MTDALPPSPDAREAAKRILHAFLPSWPATEREIESVAADLTAFAATESARRPRDADALAERVLRAAWKAAVDAVESEGDLLLALANTDETCDVELYEAAEAYLRRAASRASSEAPSASAARQTDATTDKELSALRALVTKATAQHGPSFLCQSCLTNEDIDVILNALPALLTRAALSAPALPDAGAPTRNAPEAGDADATEDRCV